MISARAIAVAAMSVALVGSNVSLAEEEKPNIHGFFEVPFKTAYITPRGLVVEDEGLIMQPIVGLVIPIDDTFTFVGGIWNSIHTEQDDDEVGAWNESDPFASFSAKWDKFEFSATYVVFLSPDNAFDAEHNLEFAVKYSDDWFDSFSINPYAKLFWAMWGDSTVVLGREGDTYDVELGVVPTYKLPTQYPVTLTFPTFVTVGPENFWGGDNGNFGVFSTGVTATMPLEFIPKRYGNWHTSIGVTYYHLINDNLVTASEILGTGGDRDNFVGFVSVGFNF